VQSHHNHLISISTDPVISPLDLTHISTQKELPVPNKDSNKEARDQRIAAYEAQCIKSWIKFELSFQSLYSTFSDNSPSSDFESPNYFFSLFLNPLPHSVLFFRGSIPDFNDLLSKNNSSLGFHKSFPFTPDKTGSEKYVILSRSNQTLRDLLRLHGIRFSMPNLIRFYYSSHSSLLLDQLELLNSSSSHRPANLNDVSIDNSKEISTSTIPLKRSLSTSSKLSLRPLNSFNSICDASQYLENLSLSFNESYSGGKDLSGLPKDYISNSEISLILIEGSFEVHKYFDFVMNHRYLATAATRECLSTTYSAQNSIINFGLTKSPWENASLDYINNNQATLDRIPVLISPHEFDNCIKLSPQIRRDYTQNIASSPSIYPKNDYIFMDIEGIILPSSLPRLLNLFQSYFPRFSCGLAPLLDGYNQYIASIFKSNTEDPVADSNFIIQKTKSRSDNKDPLSSNHDSIVLPYFPQSTHNFHFSSLISHTCHLSSLFFMPIPNKFLGTNASPLVDAFTLLRPEDLFRLRSLPIKQIKYSNSKYSIEIQSKC
jgi:hypothetical protein